MKLRRDEKEPRSFECAKFHIAVHTATLPRERSMFAFAIFPGTTRHEPSGGVETNENRKMRFERVQMQGKHTRGGRREKQKTRMRSPFLCSEQPSVELNGAT